MTLIDSPFSKAQEPPPHGAILKCKIEPPGVIAWWGYDGVVVPITSTQADLLVQSLTQFLAGFSPAGAAAPAPAAAAPSPAEVDMNWIEEMAITVVMGIIHAVVKNPAKAAAIRAQLLGIADDIYLAYGITPPTHT